MNILVIGTDRKIFEKDSDVRKRVIEYSTLAEEYYVIVFSLKSHNLKTEKIASNAWVIPTNSSSKLLYVFDAIRLGKKMSDIDVISAQDPFESGLVAYLISIFLKSKLQLQIHTDFLSPYFNDNFLNKIRIIIAKIILPRADLIRVVSVRIKNSIKRLNLKAKISVLPIFIDAQKIISHHPKMDVHEKYTGFSKIILSVSRFEKEKKIEDVIEVFNIISKNHTDIALVILGDGSERKKIEDRVKNLNLSAKVFFEGWQEDVISYYKTSDIYLSTSGYEGYGLSLMEATVSGLPVVTTDVGVVGDVLVDRINALVCPVGDVACLSAKLEELIENSVLYAKIKHNALKISDELIPRVKYRYLEDYRKTLVI
jgi:glycosyltransferase involved in cell wall biosynthesis